MQGIRNKCATQRDLRSLLDKAVNRAAFCAAAGALTMMPSR